MSYAEVQKIHHIRNLRPFPGVAARWEVLRTICAIALDQDTAAWCLGSRQESSVERWPSTIYAVLANAAMESSSVWRRCSAMLDRRLHGAIEPYTDRSAAELAQAFSEGRESLGGEELAALLWCLIRRRCASDDLVAERLSRELEVVAAQRLNAVLS
jgi:hypothetical protein